MINQIASIFIFAAYVAGADEKLMHQLGFSAVVPAKTATKIYPGALTTVSFQFDPENAFDHHSIDITARNWRSVFMRRGARSASEWIEVMTTPGYDDFKFDPPREVEFQGYPAWTFSRSYTVYGEQPLPKDRTISKVKEKFLIIQRRWGFIVIQYINAQNSFERELPQFEAFLSQFKLLPEPPAGPWVISVAAILLLGAAIWGVLVLIKRKRQA